MLKIDNIQAGYGETRILHRVNLSVQPGHIHALLGRNGAGKTTTLKMIAGHIIPSAGMVSFEGQEIGGLPAYEIARRAIAYVPETRDIFSSLSVRENLLLAGRLRKKMAQNTAQANGHSTNAPLWDLERVLDFFPALKNRLFHGGGKLSGGEQQMLAIGRALMMSPRLLLLDEPTEGLAPPIVSELLGKLKSLRAEGMSLLLVEQNIAFAAALADEISLMGRGQIMWHGDQTAFRDAAAQREKWLGIKAEG